MTELLSESSSSEEKVGLDEIFRLVHERKGIDLRAYRQKTIERRVTSRFQKLRLEDYQQYAAYLTGEPEETQRLLEHVTIKVSRFFRDAGVFAQLRDMVLPTLVQHKEPQDRLTIWSAGCGRGEEAYSLSLLFEEMAREGNAIPEVTVWGTDVDEGALAIARQGTYSEDALAETPQHLTASYFVRHAGRAGYHFELQNSVREKVTFLHHDLLSGATDFDVLPFDLVLCRNVLIYFERPAQDRAISLLASSIAPRGFLCLGEAEHIGREHQSHFEIVDRQSRLYRRV